LTNSGILIKQLNLCVLASGRGTNLRSIINSRKSKRISSKVSLVISNNSNSGALALARKHGIPTFHLSEKRFESKKSFDKALLRLLYRYKIDMIILAGYMKLVRPAIIRKFRNRILNIHPALLPFFGGKGMYGMKVHQAVIESGSKITGATVHIIDEKFDHGPVVTQKAVRVSDDDTPETLQRKVQKVEHKLYPEAIKLFETSEFSIKGRKVQFS
jgi:phosphoribosylglycinamide formyltransferase-1